MFFDRIKPICQKIDQNLSMSHYIVQRIISGDAENAYNSATTMCFSGAQSYPISSVIQASPQRSEPVDKQHKLKIDAAKAALKYIQDGEIIGIGTGSTVNCFIELLKDHTHRIEAAVSSSEASTKLLKAIGIDVIDLNDASNIPVYIDGADESNHSLELIKGGGGALSREKIIAAASSKFVCIADNSKYVETLGNFPLPVEVLPMARSYVARELVKLGGDPVYRSGFITDNGNVILDVHNLQITQAKILENKINQITGVVTNGLFANRPADHLILATESGIKEY